MGEAAIWDSGTWDQSKWDIDTVVAGSARGGGGGTGTYNEERIFKARQKQREDALKEKNAPKIVPKIVAKKDTPKAIKPVADVSGEILETLLPVQDTMGKYNKLAADIDVAVIEDQRKKARIAEIERLEEVARIKAIEAEMKRNDDLAIIMMLVA
tara:strand:- start:362 stop:826 length:465 start_codon:yes stop_codon:yes gene_type:complete